MISIITLPANGTATVNNGGTPNNPTDDTIDYTPNPDFNGTDMITYEICDFDGDCDQAVVTVTVTPENDLPDAVDDMASVPEDGSVNIDPLPNDDFGGDGPATGPITIVTPPGNGTATVDDNGTPNDPTDDTIDYTPDPNYNGPDQIVYEICDADGDCVQATIDITVDPVNDVPDAVDDPNEVTDEDTPVNIDVLANDDFGGDGPSMGAITVVTQPANGTATVDDNGTPNDPTDDTVDYIPNANYNGPDQFTYEICDSNGDCDQAVATVTVNPVNDLPDAVDDPNETTPEDTPVNIDVLANDDFGGDGPSMGAITVVTQPANGTATVDDNGTPNDPTDDTVDYIPNANYNGPDQFTYEICDSNGDCDQAVATIDITPVNDLPDAVDDMASVSEDGSTNIDPLPNDDFGGDGPSMTPITIVTPPANGTATVDDNGTPNDPTDDTIDYTPNPDYNGPDQIVYEICDSNGDCDQATIDITVDPVNDLPDAMDDPVTATEDTPLAIDPLPNDDFGGDGPGMGPITIVTPPANGTATVDDNGTPNDPTDDTIDYTPDPNYNGPDQIVYEICDSNGDCDQATIDITVNPVNDVPDAVDDPVTALNEDSPGVNIDVLNNDTFGGDGPSTGTITIVTPPANGTATVNDGGTPNDPTDDSVDYVPNANYNGMDQFTYEICDSNGDCDQAVAPITVNPVNDFPNAVNDLGLTTMEDVPLNIDPLINDTFGGDGPSTGTITITANPLNGTATVNDGGTPNDPTDDTIDYTPNANFHGNDLIVYEI
ncbi:MAG: tandem-95 repeat protein, partial [Lewinellaceae bacterium]|nr:tandem-95 repeat protein [Lewinellaceae bacterium]